MNVSFIVSFVDHDNARREESFDSIDAALRFSNGCDDRGFRNVSIRRVGENSRVVIGKA